MMPHARQHRHTCLGPEGPAGSCQEPGIVHDHARGGMVCLDHLPPGVGDAIMVMIAAGTLEDDLIDHNRMYSWSLGSQ
jgi:hypothetical protein